MSKQNQTLALQPSTPFKRADSPDKDRANKLSTSILIKLGLRSHCCGAPIVTWAPHKHYCETCEQWLTRSAKR